MKLYYPIEVDLFRPYPLPIMEAQQNNIGRGAQVTLKANGAIIQPTDEGLTFWAKKPDGTVSYLAATLSGTNVQLDFTNQMLVLPGMVQVEIRMTSGDGADKTDISTPIFNVRVNPSNIDDTAPESTNEFTALVTALAEVAELKKNGLKGDPGEAATLEIGTVTATEPGGAPAVTNSGTSQDAVLNFVLPRGQQGPKGDPGAAGKDGKDGKEQIVFAAASAFPATGDPAMLYVDNTVSPAIIYTWSGSAYVQASADISTVMAMLATPFSETASYTAGKYVTYNGQYWRFTTDKAAGAWDASKAEATNIGAELSALNAKSIKVKAFKFLNTGSWQGKNTILSIDTGIDNYEDGKEFAVAFAANSEVDTKLIYIPCVKNNRWYVSSNCYTDGGAGPNGFFFVVLTI